MRPKRCFPPVVDANTRVLVLGSLPGEISLAQGQYYANKQNRFWLLIGDIISEVGALATGGTVEVTLLGQNVNSYGRDLTTRWRGRARFWPLISPAPRVAAPVSDCAAG